LYRENVDLKLSQEIYNFLKKLKKNSYFNDKFNWIFVFRRNFAYNANELVCAVRTRHAFGSIYLILKTLYSFIVDTCRGSIVIWSIESRKFP